MFLRNIREDAGSIPATGGAVPVGLKTVYADPRFSRLAPLSATCIGMAWALQGLWAAPWLSDVEHVDRPELLQHLPVTAIALSPYLIMMACRSHRHRVVEVVLERIG